MESRNEAKVIIENNLFALTVLSLHKELHLRRSLGFRVRGGFRPPATPTPPPPPYFLQSLVFPNHFEELFEVEQIIINAPLTYVYPITVGICLTSNQSFVIWQTVILFFQHSLNCS